jgi:hypothetical protein
VWPLGQGGRLSGHLPYGLVRIPLCEGIAYGTIRARVVRHGVCRLAESGIQNLKYPYAQLGLTLPAGVGLDQNGKPTRDAGEARHGGVLPFGGRNAYYMELIARAGLVGIHLASAQPHVVPPGGTRPVLGMNPLCSEESLLASVVEQGTVDSIRVTDAVQEVDDRRILISLIRTARSLGRRLRAAHHTMSQRVGGAGGVTAAQYPGLVNPMGICDMEYFVAVCPQRP